MSAKKVRSLDRAIDAGVELIATRRIDQLSIADLATAGHCSTATLYDAFGSKEQLLAEILERSHKSWPVPEVPAVDGQDAALCALLDFLRRRIEFLSAPRTGALARAAMTRSQDRADRLETLFAETDPLPGFTALVAQAIAAGDLRDSDAASVAYCIHTTASYEPMIASWWFGSPVDTLALVRTAVRVHLTAAGEEKLGTWLSHRVPSDAGDVGPWAFAAHRPKPA